ncbi:hypothetical protein OSB04_un000889 [Centaurea solstitialis]|uniref:DUF4371 domain-containing protein n=1 Tax=Centaurea solstitialis TaxID=347529 RepID=A0AA38S517_9ASTR|nr:hypothetical protein OSB04_un000889 [Centaurea solstitialis]
MKLEGITYKKDRVNRKIIFSNEEIGGRARNSILLGWNKRECLDIYNNGGPHTLAVQNCQNLMNQSQSIATVFNKQTNLTKYKNQTKVYVSIDCVIFLLRQGLAFRGHNETSDSRNKGNFLELLYFYAERNDKEGNVVLKNALTNAQMTCIIRKEIGDNFFAILVDESCDVSSKEEMMLLLWFINDERLITIFILHPLFRSSTTIGISLCCKKYHDLNDFFELISRLLNMTESSYKRRDKLRDKQATRVMQALADGELESGTGLNQEIGIKRPSDTLLEDIMEDANCQDHRSEARRMLKSILTFDFIFFLHLIVDILGITNELKMTLQRKYQDIINTMHQQPLLGNITSNKYDAKLTDMEHPYFNEISHQKSSKLIDTELAPLQLPLKFKGSRSSSPVISSSELRCEVWWTPEMEIWWPMVKLRKNLVAYNDVKKSERLKLWACVVGIKTSSGHVLASSHRSSSGHLLASSR